MHEPKGSRLIGATLRLVRDRNAASEVTNQIPAAAMDNDPTTPPRDTA